MTRKHKLIIDAQIFQTAAKDRGMGRYTQQLTQALLRQVSSAHEVELVLSKNLPMPAELKAELAKDFKKAKIVNLDLLSSDTHKVTEAFLHNEQVLNNYIQEFSKDSDVEFVIMSLFQEPAVCVFPDGCKKILLFYDLIPYLYHRTYEPVWGHNYPNYLRRFKYVYEADKILTISQTIADDLRMYLGMPDERLAAIDGAAIRAAGPPKKPNLDLPPNYILMPTSDDPRKNNQKAVAGFEEFLSVSGNSGYKLVITSTINDSERAHLSTYSKNLIFTGNMSEQEMDWLYKNCRCVLFVPEYEGLGLPVLEAVDFEKPVACSAISAFTEISKDAFRYCSYDDVSDIAAAIEEALKTKPSRDKYRRIKEHYNWDATAKRMLEAIAHTELEQKADKPKIAIFAPTPDGFSAIGKVVAESHAVLSRHFDIDYYLEPGVREAHTRPNFLKYVAPVYPAGTFVAALYKNYDAVIYHIGNGDYHLESIKNSLYLPGYVIPHDTDIREAYRILGEEKLMQPERIKLELSLDKADGPHISHGLTSVVDRQLGVMTHSRYANNSITEILDKPVSVVTANLPSAPRSLPAERPEGPLTIGLAGIIADVKGIEVIEAIAKNPDFHNCMIELFGYSHITPERILELNSYPNVSVTTALSDFDFQTNLARLDVLVNYRMNYNGETSLSTIEAMRAGVCVIVRDIGWYSELPDSVAIKVKSIEDVFFALSQLATKPELAAKMAKTAREYIAKHFSHEQYAQALKALINEYKTDNPNRVVADALHSGRVKNKNQYLRLLKDNSLI